MIRQTTSRADHGPRQGAPDDRYGLDEGRVLLTGVQALVRVLIDQRRADAARSLRTATFVSGYQGSPLAGFDRELDRARHHAAAHNIRLQPGVNEELAATAVWGSQLVRTLPGPRYDGVLGVWYGKAPGVDRSADAIRHGNYVGTDPNGGVLALCGDDPASKSSTLPSASESLLAALRVPVLVPGSVQEVLDLGRHAIACSRASGLWAALKIVTNVADAYGTVNVGASRVQPDLPVVDDGGVPYIHRPSAHLLAPESLEMERTLVDVRLELAKRYGQLNKLNRVIVDGPQPWLGIVVAGATTHDTLRALADLGLDRSAPVRVLQVGMLFPFDENAVRAFAAGLDEVIVLEEKGPFLERLVRDALHRVPNSALVIGNHDEADAPLVPAHGTLDADTIAGIVAKRLLRRGEAPVASARLEQLRIIAARPRAQLGGVRTPFFCSGCPHNSSTVADEDTIVGAGIGCHTMVMLSPERHGKVSGITQMGGEGAQWIGAAPFADVPHFVQNLGDGTFHHSGSLAVRAAVAAGLNVTYKLLFNGYVAMTGGQHVEGDRGVVATTYGLAAEGVKRIVITTEDVGHYNNTSLPAVAEVRPRREIVRVQRELAATPGVTVLLHDQACAAELRRERKSGRAIDPPHTVFINERVCEGCGDCGAVSGCLSVEPVDTEFGRKTRINTNSCNKDYTCLRGDCPSFITTVPSGHTEPPDSGPVPPFDLPAPVASSGGDLRLRMVGIGGTGVVTVNQVLGTAALLEGRYAYGLDQTGLSQKAGPVVSDLRLVATPREDSITPSAGTLDVLLGFDLLGAATPRNLTVADPVRTIAVVSDSVIPTGQMVVDVDAQRPDRAAARHAIDSCTRSAQNVYLDAQNLAAELLGDATFANMLVVGAALQLGALPVSLQSVQEAIRLNGVAADQNLMALDWGRAWVVDPEAVLAMSGASTQVEISRTARQLVDSIWTQPGELQRLLEVRVPDLIAWGGSRPAERYARAVAHVAAIESVRTPGSTALTEAVAVGLHKLMAYKDEYEVARLHLDGLASLPVGTDLKFHLHPPLLRAMGMTRKLVIGEWFVGVFRALHRARGLRGTPFDPFGYAKVRRIERTLSAEYLGLVDRALRHLDPTSRQTALEICRLPELVRGYEQIKLENVQSFRARAAELCERIANENTPDATRRPVL